MTAANKWIIRAEIAAGTYDRPEHLPFVTELLYRLISSKGPPAAPAHRVPAGRPDLGRGATWPRFPTTT